MNKILTFILLLFYFNLFSITVTKTPGSYTNNGGDASFGVGNLASSDNSRNCVTLNNGQSAKGYFRDFGFAIPVGAVITNITITVEGIWSANNDRDATKIRFNNGAGQRTQLVDNKNLFSNAESTASYSSNVAGGNIHSMSVVTELTRAIINGTNFGVEIEDIKSKTDGATFCLDYVSISVTYSAPCNPCYSIASGNFDNSTTVWSDASGGSPGFIPTNDETGVFYIERGYTIDLNVNFELKDLTVGTAQGSGILRWTDDNVILDLNSTGAESSITVASGSSITENGRAGSKIRIENDNDGATVYTITINDNTTGILIDDVEINGDNSTVNYVGTGITTINNDFLFAEDDCTVNNNLTGTFTISNNLVYGNGDDDDNNLFYNGGTINIGGDITIISNSDNNNFNTGVGSTTTITDDILIDEDNFDINNQGSLTFDDYIVNSNNDDDHDIVNSGTILFDVYDGGNANGETITNTGTITQTGTFSNLAVNQTTFTNSTNARWNYAGTGHDTDIRLYCSASGNVFNYNRSTAQGMIDVQSDDYHHLEITNANTKTAVDYMDIEGNLTISGSSTLNTNGFDITIAGNWLNSSSGGFTEGTRSVTFDGSTNQILTCSNIGTETFYNLLIDKSNGTLLTINNHISISNTLNFSGSNGYIVINTNNLTITSWNNGDIIGYDSNKFIIVDQTGFIKYTGVDNGEVLNIPMGLTTTSTNYALVDLNMTDAGDGTFDANLCSNIYKTGETCGGATAETDSVVTYTWNLVSTSTDAVVKLYWDSSKELTTFDRNLCDVAHYNGSDWVNLSSYGAATSEGGSLYSRTGTTDGFSPFGIQMSGSPLPVELINFEVKLNNMKVYLNWTTVSEINNSHFNVQRSSDGIVWETISTVNGNGNSYEPIDYSSIDNNPLIGKSYYRLQQYDFDGTNTISSINIISIEKNNININIYPNPNNGDKLYLDFVGYENINEIVVILYNSLGEMSYSKIIAIDNGNTLIGLDLMNRLKPGVYIISGSNKNDYFNKKILIK